MWWGAFNMCVKSRRQKCWRAFNAGGIILVTCCAYLLWPAPMRRVLSGCRDAAWDCYGVIKSLLHYEADQTWTPWSSMNIWNWVQWKIVNLCVLSTVVWVHCNTSVHRYDMIPSAMWQRVVSWYLRVSVLQLWFPLFTQIVSALINKYWILSWNFLFHSFLIHSWALTRAFLWCYLFFIN
jgi:hypothetical protein